jgi:hypothetical protein
MNNKIKVGKEIIDDVIKDTHNKINEILDSSVFEFTKYKESRDRGDVEISASIVLYTFNNNTQEYTRIADKLYLNITYYYKSGSFVLERSDISKSLKSSDAREYIEVCQEIEGLIRDVNENN